MPHSLVFKVARFDFSPPGRLLNPLGKEFTVRNLQISIFAVLIILAIRNRPVATAAVALFVLVNDRRS